MTWVWSGFNETQQRVIRRVHGAGACTSRSLVASCGPYPNWHPLISMGLLVERATVYGPVVAYSARGYDWAYDWGVSMGLTYDPAYLQAPGTLADRAYQVDALVSLTQRGYESVACKYKRGRAPGTYTDHIVSMMLRAPLDRVPDRCDSPRPSLTGIYYDDTRGYPYLYASISGGGITPARLRALLKVHQFSPAAWGHPLLIATPDPAALRPMLRRLAAARSENRVPLVELLDLPVPNLVTKGA